MAKSLGRISSTGTQQGFPKESAWQAMLMDLFSTGGKNVSQIKSLYEFGQPEPETKESAQVVKRRAALNQVVPVLSQLKDSVTQSRGGWKGWMEATLGSMIPGWEGKADEAIKRQSEGYARLIANALATEVGVATDKDVNRWLGLMPRAKDSKAEQVEYLNRLIKQVTDESAQYGIDTTQTLAPLTVVEEAPTKPPTAPITPPAGLSEWLFQQPTQQAAWSVGGPLTQMYGGKAENLPRVGAILGGLLGLTVGHPHIGAGVGYAGGERVKQLVTGGQVGDIEAQKQAALKGVGAGALSRVGQFGVEKVAAPVIGRVARKPLQWLLQKTGSGVTAPTEALAETAAGLKRQAPPGFQEEVGKEMAPFTKELYGKLYGGEKTMNLLPYRQQLSGKYDELSKYGGQALYKDITEQIHQGAPATKLADWLLSAGYKQMLPDWLKRLGWVGAGAAGTTGAYKLLGR